ncbi:MAG TPA: hypothetical protein VH541_02050 [Gaiellaceae bacterium]
MAGRACGDSPLAGVQTSALEFPFETTRAVANLVVTGTLERYSRVRFILTHAGGCVSSAASRSVDRRPFVAAYASSRWLLRVRFAWSSAP